MNHLILFSLLGVAPVVALFIGCLGVVWLDETAWGWVLLALGVGYPPGVLIWYWRHKGRLWSTTKRPRP